MNNKFVFNFVLCQASSSHGDSVAKTTGEMSSLQSVGEYAVNMIKLTYASSCCKVLTPLLSMLTSLIVLSENLNCGSLFFFFSLRAHFAKLDYKFLRRRQGTEESR